MCYKTYLMMYTVIAPGSIRPYMAERVMVLCNYVSSLCNATSTLRKVIAGCGRRVMSLPTVPNTSLYSLDAPDPSLWCTWRTDPPYIQIQGITHTLAVYAVHNMGEHSILMNINLYTTVLLTLAVTWNMHAGIALAGHSGEDWSPIRLCPSMVWCTVYKDCTQTVGG